MASDEKWYFTKEQLENTPSRQFGVDPQKELMYRQQAAYFIQDMGRRLKVSQLCINTASVYMHRFYVFHSFTQFPWNSIAAAALFLAAKVEEQPRKLEHVIRVHNICKNPRDPTSISANPERYAQQSQDLVFNENVLLQTLGFDVAIDHPHAHVVRCCHLVRASKDLAQTSYFMASTSLHLTTMCLQYKPTVVACFCIHLASKWSNWEISLSNERKEWYSYVDASVTPELLQQLTEEFLAIFSRCPPRLKDKIMAIGDGANINRNIGHPNAAPSESDVRNLPPVESKESHHRVNHHDKSADEHKHRPRASMDTASTSSNYGSTSSLSGNMSSSQQQREREYREKKERERLANQHKMQQQQHSSSSSKLAAGPHGHHRPPIDPKLKAHARPNPVPPNRLDHREVPRDSFREPFRDATDSKDVLSREIQAVRAEKDAIDKLRAIKSSSDLNNSTNLHAEHFSSDKRVDPSRSRPPNDPKLLSLKQHDARRHGVDEQKPIIKSDPDARKPHSMQQPSSQGWYDSYNKNIYDKSNLHLKQPMSNSTSQIKVKSPFTSELAQKSVPKSSGSSSSIKSEPQNGSSTTSSNSNGSYSFAINDEIKTEYKEIPVKKPSMFSPEKTPPRKFNNLMKTTYDNLQHQNQHIPLKKPLNHGYDYRPPKKTEPPEGFENLFRDSANMGLNAMNAMMNADIPELNDYNTTSLNSSIHFNMMHIQPQFPQKHMPQMHHPPTSKDIKELKPSVELHPIMSSSSHLTSIPSSQPIVNGIETNPTLISNLLKEAPPSVLHLPTISGTLPDEILDTDDIKDKDFTHKDKKKKNKEKHKHKDKDKSREEKEKKRKHKDKDKEKHKSKNRDKDKANHSGEETPSQPIKITISKDKIHPQQPEAALAHSHGLKIKIPKDKIKTDIIEPPTQTPGIKIKISKDVINNIGAPEPTKKRERDRSSPLSAPPHKVSKYNRQHTSSAEKQNGRNSFGKVGEDEATIAMHRYSEPSIKYANKGTSGT